MNSYLKFLSRNKLYTLIEAFGLAVSLCFTILIGSYVWQQYGIAYGSKDYERIYSLSSEDIVCLSYDDKDALDSEIPEVELATRYHREEYNVQVGENHYNIHKAEVDKEFFEMFPSTGIDGAGIDALKVKGNVLVSRTFANTVSVPGEDLIGKRIICEDETLTIAGVFDDFKDIIFPHCDIVEDISNLNQKYYYNGGRKFSVIGNVMTLFKVKDGVDRKTIEEKAAALCEKNYPSGWIRPQLHRLDELYFFDGADSMKHTSKSMLEVLTVVSLALLLSAMFNYINLSAALTGKRAKEMAVRRLLGAGQKQVFLSGILESIAFTAVCFIAGLLMAVALTPMMNSLLIGEDADLFTPLRISVTGGSLGVYLLFILILGVLAGVVPARMASRFSPIDTVKGGFRRSSKMVFSKIFIIIQSALAVVLLSMGLLMELQMRHMIGQPMHAQTGNLYFLNPFFRDAATASVLADKMKSLPEVKQIGLGNSVPGRFNMGIGVNDESGKNIMIQFLICDSTFFRLICPEVVEDFGHPLERSLWLGETTARALNITDSTEAYYKRKFSSYNNTVVESIGGIIKDIPVCGASNSRSNTYPYMAITVQKAEDLIYSCGLLMQTTDESKETAEMINSTWRKYQKEADNYDEAFCNWFISDNIRSGLAPARRAMRLVEIFMVLSIILSLLGLVAMSTWYSDQKAKEIAVRKVFGGTVESETASSVRSYLAMTVVSCAIGVPVAVFLAARYLEEFAYRISGYWWVFALATVISLVISLLSVLWQTLRAARTNPATELKKE